MIEEAYSMIVNVCQEVSVKQLRQGQIYYTLCVPEDIDTKEKHEEHTRAPNMTQSSLPITLTILARTQVLSETETKASTKNGTTIPRIKG